MYFSVQDTIVPMLGTSKEGTRNHIVELHWINLPIEKVSSGHLNTRSHPFEIFYPSQCKCGLISHISFSLF